eukprot:4329898-Prymnesium_polylepis.1
MPFRSVSVRARPPRGRRRNVTLKREGRGRASETLLATSNNRLNGAEPRGRHDRVPGECGSGCFSRGRTSHLKLGLHPA